MSKKKLFASEDEIVSHRDYCNDFDFRSCDVIDELLFQREELRSAIRKLKQHDDNPTYGTPLYILAKSDLYELVETEAEE
jgi:hypothetical protein